MKKLKRGVLIVFEGIDGSGKTTQAQILLSKLERRGFVSVYFREPSLGRWGREIKKKAALADSVTPEEELDLFQKDRKENVEKNLIPSLRAGKVVILDRYYFSTIAYQGAKGIDPEVLRKMNEAFAVKPDLVFILDVKPEQGLARIADRGTKDALFEREDYLVQVRRLFLSMKGKNIIHIDASQSQEAIAESIDRIAMRFIVQMSTRLKRT